MDAPLSPPDLANTVTSFCTILAGAVTLAFCRLLAPQPTRWVFVYLCLFVTGLPTFGFHGWGTEPLRLADVGTNLLLAFAIQLAVLGDFYAPRTRAIVGAASGFANAAAVLWMLREALTGARGYAVDLGGFGGFYAGEAVLILDCFLVVGLLYARRRRVPPRARPLLHLVTLSFLLGLGLASAAGDVVHGRWIAYHALWHVVGAFGFLLFWGFNHLRFSGMETAPTVTLPEGLAR